jgi:basic membrane protein A
MSTSVRSPRLRRSPSRPTGAALALVTALALAGCGAGGGGSADPERSPAEKSGEAAVTSIGLMMDLPRNDGSFGQETTKGAQAAADELGAELTVVDSLEGKPAEARSALTNLAKANDIVLVVANAVISDLPRVANQFDDVVFAVDAEEVDGAPNILYRIQNWYPLGYLAGVAAASESTTGTVGFVGGGLIPPTIEGKAGFADGAKATDPDIEVLDTITNSFTDPTAAKSATAAQIGGGADVIYSFLDAAHAGAVQASVEASRDTRLIGVINSKCEESQGLELGDTMADHAGAITNLVRLAAQGGAESGTVGLEDRAVQRLEFCDDAGVDAATLEAVDQAWEALSTGEIPIPEGL